MATYRPTSSSGTNYTSTLATGDIIQGDYTGSVIPVTVPAGRYKLECYGAQGGSGQTGTYSSGSSTSDWVSPASSDFSVYEIYGGNAALRGDCYAAYLGKGYMSHNEEGYITLRVNTAGTYKFIYFYETESGYDKVNFWIDGDRILSNKSGQSEGEEIYDLSVGDYIELTYEKDGSQSTGYDCIDVSIYVERASSTPSGWNYSSSAAGGYGGYSYGNLTLTSPTTLYLRTGQQGQSVIYSSGSTPSQQIIAGGWNGGGDSKVFYYSDVMTSAGSGGGASEIRISSDSQSNRVIVAGGGGGSAGTADGTNKRGGGTNGSSPSSSYYGTQTAAGSGGSFASGGIAGTSTNWKYGSGGGGGGWYGGGAYSSQSDDDSSIRQYNGGGSGYVYTSSTASSYPSGCALNSSYYLTDAATTTSTQTGNGLIKITCLEKLRTPKAYVKTSSTTWSPAIKTYIKINSTTWKEGEL